MRADDALGQKFGKDVSRGFGDQMTLTEQGLVLGAGALLAKMGDDGLCLDGEEERILALLSVAHGHAVSPVVLGRLRRASKHWRGGDKSLAAIYLAQSGLGKLDAAGAYRLSLAAKLIDVGVSPRELARDLGFELPADLIKYDPDQPRVPAGSGRESGQWTSGDAAVGGDDSTLIEGRSAGAGSGKPHPAPELPKDAIVVTQPDGTPIADPDSPTGNLMAPPRANFHEVYAAGTGTRATNLLQIDAAVGHWGQFDFQRDSATHTYYPLYKHASNYAVGVFMAGVGYTREQTSDISETFAYFYSRNYKTDMVERKYWTYRDWDDAHDGTWK